MTPEQLVQILVALNAAGGVGILLQMWQHRQERGTKREDSYDQRQQQRIDDLEQTQKERDNERDNEIKSLRAEVQQCHENHAQSLAEVAGLKAQTQWMQRQIDDLLVAVERRHIRDSRPPEGYERRGPEGRG